MAFVGEVNNLVFDRDQEQELNIYVMNITRAVESYVPKKGASRQQIKDWIVMYGSMPNPQDELIDEAIKQGVVTGVFNQPKGTSGSVMMTTVRRDRN